MNPLVAIGLGSAAAGLVRGLFQPRATATSLGDFQSLLQRASDSAARESRSRQLALDLRFDPAVSGSLTLDQREAIMRIAQQAQRLGLGRVRIEHPSGDIMLDVERLTADRAVGTDRGDAIVRASEWLGGDGGVGR